MDNLQTPQELLRSKDWYESKRFKMVLISTSIAVLLHILSVVAISCLPSLKDTIEQQLHQAIDYLKYVTLAYVGGDTLTSVSRQLGISKLIESAPPTPPTIISFPETTTQPQPQPQPQPLWPAEGVPTE